MTIFNKIKTNNPIIDTILSTVILTFLGYLLNVFSESNFIFTKLISFENLYDLYYKKNVIELEGKTSSTTSIYNMSHCVSATYSRRFKALWLHITNNIEGNHTINKIKESYSTRETVKEDTDGSKSVLDFFIVSQPEKFILNKDKEIYAICKSSKEDDGGNNEKVTTKTEKIIIQIYSYKITLSELQQYIDNITLKYLSSIKTNRLNKKFIYILEKLKYDDDENRYSCWSETEFVTCRNFSNLFFDGKHDLINKINFFINNKEWYEQKGIPWTCGIGLSGPPGTGKTSFIKALAKHTGYHIVFISLKLLKTKQQLQKFFFEDTYNSNNEKHSITFDKKITVFEDIDCIGDIVLKRENQFDNKTNIDNKTNFLKGKSNTDTVELGDVIKTVLDMNSTETGKFSTVSLPKDEEPITLDDILNLWDGIRETPGRILVISSNHYDKLDSALTRPGRIDITHEFTNASHKTISEMYNHLFGIEIDPPVLQSIKEYFYSPAEIINIFLESRQEENFIKRLSMNKKLQ
jgi:hypothetical protein